MGPGDEVARLELELLTPATRGDRTRLEALLHAAFVEVGSSGRRWTRPEIIAELVAAPDPGELEVHDLTAHVLGPDTVLVTSVTRRAGIDTHRCSVWVRGGGRWQVRYHQGTPVAPSG